MTGKTLLTVALIGMFWGLNWPAVKYLLTEVPPFTIRAVALSSAAIVLAIYTRALGYRLWPPVREIPWMALTGLLTIFGFNVLVALGQELTETSKAAIIAYTMPALTAVFSVVFLGTRLSGPVILALIVGMAGIGVLAAENIGYLIANPLGPGIMVTSAIVWALGTVAMKAGAFSLPPLPLTVWFLGVSGAACWPFVAVLEWERLAWPSTGVAAVWAWHALLPMVLGYALWTRLVGQVPAPVAAIATLLAPVVGVSSSMLLLGDPVTWHKIAALGLILGSILLTFWRPSTGRNRPAS